MIILLSHHNRYDSLGQAIAELNTTFAPCCLTHNDLKLDNILLRIEWDQALLKAEPSDHSLVRLQKNGLTLHIKRDRHLRLAEKSPIVGDTAAIRMPRNLVENGILSSSWQCSFGQSPDCTHLF